MTTPAVPARSGAIEGALPLVVVAVGGAVGALLRWGLGEVANPAATFPWVTLAINVAGCFVLAAAPAVSAVHRSPGWTLFLGPGVLGGFTTVSSWAFETRELAAGGELAWAGSYVAGTLLACLAAASFGRLVVRRALGDEW